MSLGARAARPSESKRYAERDGAQNARTSRAIALDALDALDAGGDGGDGVTHLVRADEAEGSPLRVLRDADRARLERFALSTSLQSLERVSSLIDHEQALGAPLSALVGLGFEERVAPRRRRHDPRMAIQAQMTARSLLRTP